MDKMYHLGYGVDAPSYRKYFVEANCYGLNELRTELMKAYNAVRKGQPSPQITSSEKYFAILDGIRIDSVIGYYANYDEELKNIKTYLPEVEPIFTEAAQAAMKIMDESKEFAHLRYLKRVARQESHRRATYRALTRAYNNAAFICENIDLTSAREVLKTCTRIPDLIKLRNCFPYYEDRHILTKSPITDDQYLGQDWKNYPKYPSRWRIEDYAFGKVYEIPYAKDEWLPIVYISIMPDWEGNILYARMDKALRKTK